jgi:hypothetical protein
MPSGVPLYLCFRSKYSFDSSASTSCSSSSSTYSVNMSFILSSNVTPVILSPGASMLLINRVFTLLSAKVYQTEITIAVGLLCLYLFLYMSWSKYRKSIAHSRLKQQERCQPAVGYPHRDRILGLDLLWKLTKALQNHTFLETTRELLQQEYNTIEYLVLGNKAIVTIEPENVKTILSSKFQEFGLGNPRKRSLKPLFGDGIFNVDGMMWNVSYGFCFERNVIKLTLNKQHSRTFLRPHITRQRDEVLDIFEKHVQNLIKSLPMDGRTFDFQDSISCLMMDIATEVFLGESTDVLSSASPNLSTTAGCVFAQAFEYAQLAVSGINQLSLYEIFSKQFGDRKLKKSLQIIDCFMDRVIQKAQQSLRNVNSEDVDGEATFLEHLVKDTQEFQRIKHDILNLLLAGKDTVTALLSNTWFVLAKRPDIYAKLRAEIAMLNGERPSGQQLKDLKYLRYVLNESK